jgi:hemolysin activation/secretion protein
MPNAMGFSVGGDTGLRGLPGSFISGDTGWLGSAELSWTFWRDKNHALQLVPFIGMSGIQSTRNGLTVSDTIGSGGLLARWQAGRRWQIELGWTDQFHANNNTGYWNDWLLGNGLYTSIKFSF